MTDAQPRRAWVTRWMVAAQTVLVVVGLLTLKAIVHALDWEFIELSPLYTSVVAGGIFVIGLLVAGTLADYKEAERMPAEIRAALENIYGDGIAINNWRGCVDIDRLRVLLDGIVTSFLTDLRDVESRSCLRAIDELGSLFLEMERADVPPNYMVRLRTEQSVIRRNVLRIYHVQRIDFLPSAYVLIQTVVALLLTALVFTEIEPFGQALVLLGFISYFFVYLVRLLRIIDRPFRHGERTMDDVSLFLLHEFHDQVRVS
jgi:hypothetical protein